MSENPNDTPLQIPDKLLPLITIPKRFKIIVGGRGSGKSIGVSDILTMMVDQRGYQVACGREFQTSIADSVHASIKDEIERLDAVGFTSLENEIRHLNGGRFFYKGLARNKENIKSMKGVNIFWGEEAQTFSQTSIRVLTPTIREPGSEIWMTANPRSSKDPFSQRFIKPFEKELRSTGYYEDDLHLIIFMNYMDNPWFPDELEMERQFDFENSDRALYNHIWLGHYDDSVEGSIIKAEWFDACIDAHIKLGFEPEGVEVATHDPSDLGNDSKGWSYRKGVVFTDIQENENGDVNEGADWAIELCLEKKPDHFIWDGGGLGLGLRRQFNDALGTTRTGTQMFNGQNTPMRPEDIYEDGRDQEDSKKTNKETFVNQRAQFYWEVRDRCWRTYQAVTKGKYFNPDELISFSSDIEAMDLLRSELCRIPKKYHSLGKVLIMDKEQMKKLEIDSPNMADSVMMSWAYDPPKVEEVKHRPVRRRRFGA